jgi:hypothetical protein
MVYQNTKEVYSYKLIAYNNRGLFKNKKGGQMSWRRVWRRVLAERVTILLVLILILIGTNHFNSPKNASVSGDRLNEGASLPVDTQRLVGSFSPYNYYNYQPFIYHLPDSLSFAENPVPLWRPHVRARAERLWLSKYANPAAWQDRLRWFSNPIFRYKVEYIEDQLKINGLPLDFKFLWIHESKLEDTVMSSKGAGGPCQFMPATATNYGLRVENFLDERKFFEPAIRACVRHLRDLYEKYNDVWLTMAAYNYGESRLDRASNRQRQRDYFNLILPQETMDYVFWIVFTKEIMTHAEKYGGEESSIRVAFREDTLKLSRPLRVIDVADSLQISAAELIFFNPFLLKRDNRGRYISLNDPEDIIPKGTRVFRVPIISSVPLSTRTNSIINIK